MKYFEMIQENVESHYTLKDLKWCRSKDEDIGIIEDVYKRQHLEGKKALIYAAFQTR